MDIRRIHNAPRQLFRSVALIVYGIPYTLGSLEISMTKTLAGLGEILIDPLPNSPKSTPHILWTQSLHHHAYERWLDAIKTRLNEVGVVCEWNGGEGKDRHVALGFEWRKRCTDTGDIADVSLPSEAEVIMTMLQLLAQVFPDPAFTREVFSVKIDIQSRIIRGLIGIKLPIATSVVSGEYDLWRYNGIRRRGYSLRFGEFASYISPNYCCDLAIPCRSPYLSIEQGKAIVDRLAAEFNKDNPARFAFCNDFRMRLKESWLVISPSNPWFASALTEEKMPNGLYWQYVHVLNASPFNYTSLAAKKFASQKDAGSLNPATGAAVKQVLALIFERSALSVSPHPTLEDSEQNASDHVSVQMGAQRRERTNVERHRLHSLKVYKGAMSAIHRGIWAEYIGSRTKVDRRILGFDLKETIEAARDRIQRLRRALVRDLKVQQAKDAQEQGNAM